MSSAEGVEASHAYHRDYSQVDMRSIIQAKQQELQEINEYRINTLEQSAKKRNAEYGDLLAKFNKLKEDFNYNITLIEERDTELDRFEATVNNCTTAIRDKDVQVSELRIQAADIQSQLRLEQQKRVDVEQRAKAQVKDLRDKLENARWTYEDQFRVQREELEREKAILERQLRERDEDADAQRRELAVQTEAMLRTRDSDAAAAMAQLQQRCRDAEDGGRALQRQLEEEQGARMRAEAKADQEGAKMADLTRQMAASQERIAESERAARAAHRETEACKTEREALVADYEAKTQDLLQSLRVAEATLAEQRAEVAAAGREAAANSEARCAALRQDLSECKRELQGTKAKAHAVTHSLMNPSLSLS